MVGEVRANRNTLSAVVDDSQFRRLADNIPTLCWMADAEGYIFWYNRRWYEYTGTTPADMEDWGWQSVHDTRSLAAVLDQWKDAIPRAAPFEMVFPIRGADGLFRPFLTRISPAFDDQGAVVNWYGVNTDISFHVEAEDVSARSDAKFRVLADSMPQMVWSAAPNGGHNYFNARWYDYTGVPIGSSDGDGWIDIFHPDDRDRVLANWRNALETGEACHGEYRLRHRSGEFHWVLARAQADRDANGNISQWYGSLTDIQEIVAARTVLKRSRDELEAAVVARTGERNLLATLVETTDVMIMALDLNYVVLAINKACANECDRIFGVRPDIGDNLLSLFSDQPGFQTAVRSAWARVIAGEEITVTELVGDPARACAYYEIKFRTLRNDCGERIGAFQFASDVTQRLKDQATLAQAQEALLHSQKLEAMGRLTGGVAHDFNNLLTPIIGSLDILQRSGIGGPREQRLIHGAYQSADRAKILVQRLLAFARRQPLQVVPIDVGELVKGLADLVASAVGPQVTLKFHVADQALHAKADTHQMEMAILNLSVNARDAMEGGGILEISVRRQPIAAGQIAELSPGDYVCISVADTGVGMDEATLARAVEPFFSTKGVGKGTGLGLSMAHGLASQLGGALTITSARGLGTEVTIWLPECDQRDVTSEDLRDGALGISYSGSVLLVDDEEHIRFSTADMLMDLGFNIHEAASAEAALGAIDAGLRPDILITDHLMPGMTGVELARAAKARLPDIRILIVSGFAEAEGIDPSLPRLTKPFVQNDLARLVRPID